MRGPFHSKMANPYSSSSHSPPPLQHPVPTHPAFIPDPPSTPVSPDGYMRFTSSPPQPPPQGQHQQAFYAQNLNQRAPGQPFVAGQYGSSSGYQQFSGPGAPPPHQQQNQQLPTGIDLAQWGVNPATAQLGFQLGQSAVAAGQDYMQKNVRQRICLQRQLSNDYISRSVRRTHSRPSFEAPFQRVKFICSSKAASRPLPLETQGLEEEQPCFRPRTKPMVTSTRGLE